MSEINIAPASVESINVQLKQHLANEPVATSMSTKAQQVLAEMAKEFQSIEKAKSDRMAKLDQVIKTFEQAIIFEDSFLLKAADMHWLELTKAQESIARTLSGLDTSKLKGASEELMKLFQSETDLDLLKNELANTTGKLVSDADIIQTIIQTINNVDKAYQTPYQVMSETLADIYELFSNVNSVISNMIGQGVVDEDTNDITIDLKALFESIQAINTALTDPTSSINIALTSISVVAADKDILDEMVVGTGLIVVPGPDGTYHLAPDTSVIDNLMLAYNGISNGWPADGNALNDGPSTNSVTTFQLSSFQTAFESIVSGVSNQLQTGTEKFRRILSTADNLTKLISSYIQANTDANKSFIR